jgi:hypothetical protein
MLSSFHKENPLRESEFLTNVRTNYIRSTQLPNDIKDKTYQNFSRLNHLNLYISKGLFSRLLIRIMKL